MAVKIDETRRYQLAVGVDQAERSRGWNLFRHGLDHPVPNPNVALAPQRLTWIEHLAALDEEIELVVRAHCGNCSAWSRGRER